MKKTEYDINRLINKARKNNKSVDKEKIVKAWEFASLAHSGQKRLNGDAFIFHPYRVADILADWKLDTTSIVAGLLHDTIEEGAATRDDIVNGFGMDVAVLVDGVTKVTGFRLKGSKEDFFVESLRKMILVMAKDLRVVLLKLADRIHNMETLYALSTEKQKENAIETLEIYAPLAERLGMSEVKGILEDLAFPYAYSKEFQKVKNESKKHYIAANKQIVDIKRKLSREFEKERVKAEIKGRRKHYYSLWKKLERDSVRWDFDKVYDIVAFRIIVPEVRDCYMALGVVHAEFRPVPNIGISDYVAQPKPNGYRSIHTKVFGPGGRIIEVQIRTYEMHEQAENGAAAHWAYTEAKSHGAKDILLEKGEVNVSGNKLDWVKQLVEWQKEITDTDEFLRAVKFDAFQSRNFVFSPNGDVFDLPDGATPVDFAFAVHTGLGNYISSAKVNGKIVPLSYNLKSGDVVEILKSKHPRTPTSSWLDFVVTSAARRRITKELRK